MFVIQPCILMLRQTVKILPTPINLYNIAEHSVRNEKGYVLKSNIARLQDYLLSNPELKEALGSESEFKESDVQWKYVTWLLKLLDLLCSTLCALHSDQSASSAPCRASAGTSSENVASPLPADALSVEQRKTVAAAFEFVTIFGITPYLVPGVAPFVQHRHDLLKRQGSTDCLWRIEQDVRLNTCLSSFLKYLSHAELRDILLSRHVRDMLSVLVQLAFFKKPSQKESMPMPNVGTVNEYLAKKNLNDLIERIPTSLLVKELLILQSAQRAKVIIDCFAGRNDTI